MLVHYKPIVGRGQLRPKLHRRRPEVGRHDPKIGRLSTRPTSSQSNATGKNKPAETAAHHPANIGGPTQRLPRNPANIGPTQSSAEAEIIPKPSQSWPTSGKRHPDQPPTAANIRPTQDSADAIPKPCQSWPTPGKNRPKSSLNAANIRPTQNSAGIIPKLCPRRNRGKAGRNRPSCGQHRAHGRHPFEAAPILADAG